MNQERERYRVIYMGQSYSVVLLAWVSRDRALARARFEREHMTERDELLGVRIVIEREDI